MPASTDYINQYEHNGTYYDLHDVDLRSKIGTANGIAELDSSGLVPASQLPSYVDDVKNGYYANSQFYPESSPTYPGYFYNNEFYKDIDHTIVITPVTDSYYYDISGNEYYTYDGSAYVQTTAPTAMTPENDKIYVNLAANPAEIYRWSGTAYAKMSSGDGGLVLGETSETAYRGDRGKAAYDHSQDSGRITSAVASGLYKVAATAQGHVAGLTAVQKSDITALGVPESDTNTTYTFEDGTNGFTVTPSDGTAQTVTVTPSIANNVTGSGTSGYIATFDGENTITNGPAIGTDTTKFLRNDGTWQVPPNDTTNTIPSAYCDTAAATAAKVASCTNYSLLDKSYLHVLIVNANTSASAITLDVNSKGAKAIYINGAASSASNYTLPAGTYLVYYASNIYYFRTDGKITGDITGNAATVNGLTVQTAVPANAVFTDNNTTYTFANGTNGFTVTPLGGTAQTVTVTPSITNNITGSGTSGYLTKFNGANTITDGPAIGSDTTKYLRNDGTWQVPPNTTYTVATGDSNGQIKVTPSSGSAYNVGVKGLGTAAYANLANTVMEVGKSASRSTATVGTWTAMCNSGQTGNPTLPSAGKWWNVISLNNWSNSSTAWVSQLAVATHDTLSGVWWRTNNASGTSIDSSTWHRLAEGDASGNANNALKVNNLTVQTAVPANAKFTDTNNAVTQTATTTNANYEVLFSVTADNTTRTEGARKNSNLTFNPSTGQLNATNFNGKINNLSISLVT